MTVPAASFLGATNPDTGQAALNLVDSNGLPDNVAQKPDWEANENGTVFVLSTTSLGAVAIPIATGSGTVTYNATEALLPVSGTLTVTVTSTGGKLSAVWSSGTIRVNSAPPTGGGGGITGAATWDEGTAHDDGTSWDN